MRIEYGFLNYKKLFKDPWLDYEEVSFNTYDPQGHLPVAKMKLMLEKVPKRICRPRPKEYMVRHETILVPEATFWRIDILGSKLSQHQTT